MRDTLETIAQFLADRKYLYAILPVIFIIIFALSLGFPHEGTLKTTTYSYTGMIFNGQPEGEGTLTYTNGDSYVGHFKEGKFEALGTFHSKAGNWSYTGNFSDGVADGKGTLTTPDGVKHPEQFKNGAIVQ
ncbi:MAG: hypothetical protein LBI43_01935 [Streptococcaceae bacterium]|jgi:hypothetical protein|nr:hypothetical protein [Streptococcaceae bacterium]